jgi:hypothetical protein
LHRASLSPRLREFLAAVVIRLRPGRTLAAASGIVGARRFRLLGDLLGADLLTIGAAGSAKQGQEKESDENGFRHDA